MGVEHKTSFGSISSGEPSRYFPATEGSLLFLDRFASIEPGRGARSRTARHTSCTFSKSAKKWPLGASAPGPPIARLCRSNRGAHLKLYLLITGSLFLTQTRLRAGDEALERGESRRSACHDVRPSNLVRAVDDCRGRGPGRSDYRGRFQSWRQTADLAQHFAHELLGRWHQSRHSRRAAAVGHQKTEFTITIRPADHRKIRPTEDFYFGTFGDTQPTAAECR
jgi:hypothetical protein